MVDEAQRALAEAKDTGQRVEVQSERGERTSVFANPDGFSFTLEQHSVPVRVTKPGGGWQVPDATLERRADGTVGPKATSAEMSFSDGSDKAPLVKISDRGRSLELDWKGDLPAPELDGANAVYRNVLPDVDLKLTATVESFQQVLVVKTPTAAANPALKELTFGLKTDGLTVRKGAAGNLAAVDGNGNTVFRSPPAQMWDSAGKAAAEPTPAPSTSAASEPGTAPQLLRTALATDATPPAPGDPSELAASGTGLEPGQGDNVSRMDVTVTQDSLSVLPETGMLTGTAPDAYPLFIDPTVTWGESERTLLRSDGYESYGWGDGDGTGQGAGKCGSWNGYPCGPGYVQKLYFEFAPDSLRGKRVLDATFRVTEPWAFQCEARLVDLVRTNNISSSTTWSSRPAELDWMVDRWVSAGRGSLCDPNSPDAPIEFNDNPEETNENLTPTVRDFAAGKFSRLTLEIRAHDETDTSAWKRFKSDAVLAVSFVALPATPTGVGIVVGASTVCTGNASAPTVIDDPTPTLTSTPQTAAGGEAGARLHAWFRIEKQAADGTWTGSGISTPTGTNFVGDGQKLYASWPSTLSEGTLYRYSSLTQVFDDAGNHVQSSGYAPWCYFKVDPTAPKAPTITFGTPYKPCASTTDCVAAGGPGMAGTFTFSPAAGDTVKSYQYQLSVPSTSDPTGTSTATSAWTTLTGSTVTATVTPDRAGTYKLEVHAIDTLNRRGVPQSVEFKVAASAGPVGHWTFTESTGAAVDSQPAGGSSDATLAGDATRTDRGRRGLITHDKNGDPLPSPETDKGLSLNGTGYAATAGPVIQTGSSYTVAAWARLDAGDRNYTVLSQDPRMTPDGWYSAFYLTYRADSKTWELRTSPKDATDGNISYQIVKAKRPATIGAWTHLAAVYDNTTKQIKLYVNGENQGSYTVAPSWTSTGAFQIGRAWWRGAYGDYWKGQIDEVKAWQQVLVDSEIADEARTILDGGFQAGELVADWAASGVSGTTVTDSSGYGQALALEGQPAVTTEGIVLDGSNDAGTTSRPLVDDTGSFTVAADVALNPSELMKKGVGYVGQAAGQQAANGSSWSLSFKVTGTQTKPNEDDPMTGTEVPVGVWQFTRFHADGTFHTVQSNPAEAEPTAVTMVAIFDAQARKISLRRGMETVEAALPSTAQPPLTAGTDQFALGKQRTGGAWTNYLPATFSQARVWAGAMDNDQQLAEQLAS
ncbi:LamG domain-containing protein [Streptomyces sp. NPDC046275]|uniref:LamG domain-containing protein n=1 Tax=Streptomyces sp. NPDC046275 TaxID=3157201 RepID=UPI0033EE9790